MIGWQGLAVEETDEWFPKPESDITDIEDVDDEYSFESENDSNSDIFGSERMMELKLIPSTTLSGYKLITMKEQTEVIIERSIKIWEKFPTQNHCSTMFLWALAVGSSASPEDI